MGDLSAPSSLRRLVEESGYAFAVIEQAVGALREQVADLQDGDPDVVAVLRAHLLATGSPSDVLKFFSLELLERLGPEAAEEVYLEAIDALARSPIEPDRTYPVERAMIRKLGERQLDKALPALAVLAGREVYPLSRTAARAVAAIVGSTDADEISDRFKRGDLPEASQPDALGEGVSRALFPSRRASSAKSSQERRRRLTLQNQLPEASSQGCLRPEGQRARQRRLQGIVRAADRDPARCGNCDKTGGTRVGHVVPPSRGGTDLPGNLVVLCGECRRRLPRGRDDAFEDDGRPAGDGLPQLSLF